MRRLFTLCSVISLLLFVSAAGFWVRTIFDVDELELHTPYHKISLVSVCGSVALQKLSIDFAQSEMQIRDNDIQHPTPGWHIGWDSQQYDPDGEVYADKLILPDGYPSSWTPIRIDTGTPAPYFSESPPCIDGWQIVIRYWFLMSISWIVPVWWLLVWSRRRRRDRLGLCRVCAYDLRSSAGRCPECGTPRAVKRAIVGN